MKSGLRTLPEPARWPCYTASFTYTSSQKQKSSKRVISISGMILNGGGGAKKKIKNQSKKLRGATGLVTNIQQPSQLRGSVFMLLNKNKTFDPHETAAG